MSSMYDDPGRVLKEGAPTLNCPANQQQGVRLCSHAVLLPRTSPGASSSLCATASSHISAMQQRFHTFLYSLDKASRTHLTTPLPIFCAAHMQGFAYVSGCLPVCPHIHSFHAAFAVQFSLRCVPNTGRLSFSYRMYRLAALTAHPRCCP